MRHVSQDREDDETREEADQRTSDSHNQSVLVNVVVALVVGRQRQQDAFSNPKTEEKLTGRVDPDFRLFQLLPLRDDVELDALVGARQGHTADEEDDEDEVGECCCDVGSLKVEHGRTKCELRGKITM